MKIKCETEIKVYGVIKCMKKEEYKMHEGENKMRKDRNRGIRRINKGTRAKGENQQVKETKTVQRVLRAKIMHEGK